METPGSDSARDMFHPYIFMGQIQVELAYGFTLLIVNKLLVVCFSIMNKLKVLDVFHPWPKSFSFNL